MTGIPRATWESQLTIIRDIIFTYVKTKSEIVEILAREHRVEEMVVNIAHQPMSADLEDLCQMVYLILLEYDDQRIQDLWEKNQINYFISRIIINNYRSSLSRYHYIIRKPKERCVDLADLPECYIPTDEDE